VLVQGSPTVANPKPETFRHALAVSTVRPGNDGAPYIYTLNMSCPQVCRQKGTCELHHIKTAPRQAVWGRVCVEGVPVLGVQMCQLIHVLLQVPAGVVTLPLFCACLPAGACLPAHLASDHVSVIVANADYVWLCVCRLSGRSCLAPSSKQLTASGWWQPHGTTSHLTRTHGKPDAHTECCFVWTKQFTRQAHVSQGRHGCNKICSAAESEG
jgi:hypothetical protein